MEGVNASAPRRATGLLLLLSRILVIWQPASLALAASAALDALYIRGTPLALVLVWRVFVAGFSVAAGLSLTHLRPAALTLAKTSLVLSGATDVFVYTTPFFPNNRMPGDTPFYIAASIAFYGGWLAYLMTSKRARNIG
jgi:hypothetical protein